MRTAQDTEEVFRRLEEAEQALEAIRSGEVDSLIVETPAGLRVYALEGESNTYRVLMETMNEGAAILNEAGVLLYCNAQFARLVDHPIEQVMGAEIAAFIAGREHAKLNELLATARNEAVRGEFCLVGRAAEVPVQLSVNGFKQEDRTVLCLVAMDLRQQKHNEAIAASEKALREADRQKNEFLAVLSHELRNPLAPVLTAVQLIQRKPGLTEDLRLPLDIIRRNLQLEARLIDDLLDLSRIEQGKLVLYRKPITVSSLLERAVEIVQPDIDTRSLHFGVHIEHGDVLVNCDASRLQQVIWNLLSNAVKFTPEGGCIGLRCYRSEKQAIIQVSDSGIGIEGDRLHTVFNAFEQGGYAMTHRFGGLGLGLAIAKKLVHLHEGTIEAYSEGRNQGTTVRVSLPIAQAGELVVDADQRAGTTPRKARVLVVEDNGDTAAMTRLLLEACGHKVQTAGDVAQALKRLEREPFDVLISDLGLPDGSGVDLMRKLRERGNAIRGIAMSGYGMPEDVCRSKEAGFSVHLTKPVEVDMLVEALSGVLQAAK